MNDTVLYDPQTHSQAISEAVDIVWGSIGIILCLFSIVANTLLVYVFSNLRRKGSVTDVIFLQLATLDCLSGFAGVFGSIFLVNGRAWFDEDDPVGDAICYPAGMLWNMASLTTPLLLSSASVGRFLAVYMPFTYEQYFKSRVVKLLMIYCWSHGFLGASVSFAGQNKDVKAYKMFPSWGYCDQNINDSFDNEALRRVLYIALFTVPVIVACTLIISCNLLVAVKILVIKIQHNQKKASDRNEQQRRRSLFVVGNRVISKFKKPAHFKDRILRRTSVLSSTPLEMTDTSVTSPRVAAVGPKRDKRLDRQRKRENQAIYMTLLLSCNYFLCYIEIIHYYVTVSMGYDFEKYYTPIFKNVTYVYLWYYFSLFFAASVNPILHLCFNPNVKKFISTRPGMANTTTISNSEHS